MKAPEFAEALLTEALPPRVEYLPPLLFSGALGLLHARAGIGKTSLALWMAYAAAGNGSFMRWTSKLPARVLYVDSEMGKRAMQERLRQVVTSAAHDVDAGMMSFVYPETSDGAGIDISQPYGQQYLTDQMQTRDILFLDNLCGMSPRGARESEEQVWARIQPWLIKLRAANKCTVILHHSGKGGTQLGSSMKEQPCDWILSMTRPADYDPESGLRADVKFEKFRNGVGQDCASFTVALEGGAGELTWRWSSHKEEFIRRIQERQRYGMKPAQIAKDLGVGTFAVIRALKDFEGKQNEFKGSTRDDDPMF